jgi:GMP synthase (glutamine-hydrolysing)
LPKVLVVNNYPTRERVVRLEKALERNGAAVTPGERDGASARRFGSFDGVVLSGSPDMMTQTTTQEKFEGEAQAVRDSCIPVLGVCFGHQLMAHAFGAQVVRDRQHVLGMVRTTVLTRDRLFEGLPRSIMLLESRHEVVKSLPDGFSLLAKSATSGIAAMKHGTRPLYGVQFHPERYTIENPEGKRVLGNFVGLLK